MAERRGRGAETLSARWLRLKGWRILATRPRVPWGEVGLLARRRRVLAFVEAKTRSTGEAADFALDRYRLRRVAVAAEWLAPSSFATATISASTLCSSSPAGFRATFPTSGKDDKAANLA